MNFGTNPKMQEQIHIPLNVFRAGAWAFVIFGRTEYLQRQRVSNQC